MIRRIVIVVAIIAGIAFIGYTYLGGFDEVKITQAPFPGYTMAGFPYKGKATDKAFQKLFETVRNDHAAGKVQGTLAAVYYHTPEEEKGQVDAFIGVIVKDSLASLPDKYTFKEVKGTAAVQAIITSHPAVAPAPHTLKERLRNYAWENKLPLQGLVIEKYLDLRHIEVEMPLKQ